MLHCPRSLLVVISCLVLWAAPPAHAQDLTTSPQQRTAAQVGLGFGIGTQVLTFGSALVFTLGPDGAIVPFAALAWANPGMAVAGIAGFEGVMRDGTLAGHYRGLGTGFVQGGVYSLAVGGVLGLGFAFKGGTGVLRGYLPPAIISFASVGIGFTVAGALLLKRGRDLRAGSRVSSRRPRVRVVPVVSPGLRGVRFGLHGVF